MTTPDTRSSIVIRKQGTYRGATKTWTNRYHFTGSVPADATHWTTFADAIVAAEKLTVYSGVSIIEAVGYDSASASSTNPHGDAVFSKSYTTAGTFTPASGSQQCPGDCAVLLRYSTDQRSTKNHPIYLMNYYHGIYRDASVTDNVDSHQIDVFDAYGDAWLAGFSDGTVDHQRCGPRGAVAQVRRVDPFVRHRDFRV